MPAPLVAAPKAPRQPNQNVPGRFLEGAKWKNYVIPSMIKWAGAQPRIFKIQPERMIDPLEAICRVYYEDNTINFSVKDPIFTTVHFSLSTIRLLIHFPRCLNASPTSLEVLRGRLLLQFSSPS